MVDDDEADAKYGDAAWRVAHLEGNSQMILGCSALLDIIRGCDRPTRHEAAMESLRIYRGQSAVFCEGQFYRYNGAGIWEIIPDDVVEYAIARYDGSVHGKRRGRINLGIGVIQSAKSSAGLILAEPGFFDRAVHGVATPSLTWVVRGRDLVPEKHHPEHRLRYAYPVDAHWQDGDEPLKPEVFTPIDAPIWETLAPTWVSFLQTCQPFDRYGQAVDFIRSLIGVSMVGMATRYQMGALLTGTLSGANGKSTLLELLRRLIFPPGTTANSDPGDWINDYQRATIVGAWGNLIDEIGEWPRKVTLRVKGAVNGNPMEGRRIGGDVFSFAPVAGWIVGANEIPTIVGVDSAFWRRWAILDFDQTIPPDKRIPDREILEGVRQELPVILMWALQGLQRTLTDGRLPKVASADQYRRDLQRDADQLSEWTRSAIAVGGDGDWVLIEQLYSQYESWRDLRPSRRKVPMVSQVEFGRRLAQWAKRAEVAASVEPGSYYTSREGGSRPARLFCRPTLAVVRSKNSA